MKNTITGIIGIVGITVGFMSAAEASDRDHGYYQEKRIVKKMRHEDERRWKYRDVEKRRHDNRRFYSHPEKQRHYKKYQHGKRFVKKHQYKHKGHRYVEKHIYHKPPRRFEKRVYHHYDHAPRHRVIKKIIVRDRHYHNNALPVIAGGIIGSAIGSDLGHGDPMSTFSGAVFGAMLGDALSHH
jgi:hypothetical protein